MVYTCFACKWRSDKKPQRSFHKFPSDNDLKQKWLDLLGKSNASVGTRTSLCCLHFKANCFRYGLIKGKRILKTDSLPSLYLETKTNNQSEFDSQDNENDLNLTPNESSQIPVETHSKHQATFKRTDDVISSTVRSPLCNFTQTESTWVSINQDEIAYLRKKLAEKHKRLSYLKIQVKKLHTQLEHKKRGHGAEDRLLYISSFISEQLLED